MLSPPSLTSRSKDQPPGPYGLLIGLSLALSIAIAVELTARRPRSPNGPISPAALRALDRDAELFATHGQSISNAQECFPLHLRDVGRLGILYLFCSEQALQRDQQGVAISPAFPVPSSIARRYNFWRRIYSLWGKDQYVMHLSEWPEVVFEAYDASRLPDAIGPIQRETMIKRLAKSQRDHYRGLLRLMHDWRREPARFTPAMRRIAQAMAHIPDDDKYLTAYQTLRLQRGQRDFIATGLALAPKYLPAIEQEFRSQGIPVEITLLAFVESSFNLKAVSRVGASGVYQIMPGTGRQYLRIGGGIDERNDPIKASRAAAKLLRLNHRLTGSWPLAITAYNHGVGGIRRAVRATGSTDIAILINRYRGNAFGFASKNFYASFLGMLATLKEKDRLFPEVPRAQPLAYDTVRLVQPVALGTLKKKYALTNQELMELNPDLHPSLVRAGGILPRGYVLKIPADDEMQLTQVPLAPKS